MFDIYIIYCKRHFFQNAIKLKKLFSQYFQSTFLLSAVGIDDEDKNIINIENYEFVNAFNQVLRMVDKKFSIFVDSSLDINDMDSILERLNFFKNNFYDNCGSYGFNVEGLRVKKNYRREIFPKLYQSNNHSLDFFIIEKSILLDIGLLTCIPFYEGEGLEYFISWMNYNNKKITLLDENLFFKRLFRLPKKTKREICNKSMWMFENIKNVYDLEKKGFITFFNQNI